MSNVHVAGYENANVFHTYLCEKLIDLHQTETKMILAHHCAAHSTVVLHNGVRAMKEVNGKCHFLFCYF